MAIWKTLKPRRRFVRSPVVQADLRLPLRRVLDGPRYARGTPEDKAWLALRREIAEISMGHAVWDLRLRLGLDAEARAVWESGRREWLASVFANDPRLTV